MPRLVLRTPVAVYGFGCAGGLVHAHYVFHRRIMKVVRMLVYVGACDETRPVPLGIGSKEGELARDPVSPVTMPCAT